MSEPNSIIPIDLAAFASPLGEEREKPPKESKRLLDYVQGEIVEAWHSNEGIPYATIRRRDGRLEHHPVLSKFFERWMRIQFHGHEEAPPSNNAIRDVREMLSSKATLDGDEREIFLRVARLDAPARIYIDLGWKTHEAVEVTAEGWKIIPVEEVPVRFYRHALLGALPRPVQGGSVEVLRPFLNLDDRGFKLCIAWALVGLSGRGPYPVLAFSGEQGTAKSTISRTLQRLVDPSLGGVRGAIKDGQDLFIAAQTSHAIVLDNLSTISDKLSDDLCRISTGGAWAGRKLYTSDEEVVLKAIRPVLLNGIPDLMSRGDLVDRCIRVSLEPMPPTQRRAEADLSAGLEKVLGVAFGALLTALSSGLANWYRTPDTPGYRMADFVKFVCAAEPDLPWERGAFLHAYEAARHDMTLVTLEGDTFGLRVRDMLAPGEAWEGTFSELLQILSTNLTPEQRADGWPRVAKGASTALRRSAPLLRQLGFDFSYFRRNGGNRDRMVRITAPSE